MSLWIALIATACAANQPVQLPEWDIEPLVIGEAVNPTPLPELCELQKAASGELIGWDAECAQSFLAYEIVAEANTDKAYNNTAALLKTEAATNHLIDAAKMQREIAIIRQDLLEEERTEHWLDNLFHRIIIALGVIGAIL